MVQLPIEREQIDAAIASKLTSLLREYKDLQLEYLTFVVILDGGLLFGARVIENLQHFKSALDPTKVTYTTLKVSSYEGTKSTGTVNFKLEPNWELINKHNNVIVLLDDIYDTGLTINTIKDLIRKQVNVQNFVVLRSFVMLNKLDVENKQGQPDYACFDIPNEFVVGYGLDYNGYLRCENCIRVINEHELKLL